MKNGSITVKVDDKVKPGDKIGEVDNTGRSDDNHLHHERRIINEGRDVKDYKDVLYKKKGQYINTTPYNPKNDLDPEGKIYKKKSKGPTGGPEGLDFSNPGADHPDDTFSVADAVFPTTPIDLEDAYYRLAVKKGKTVVISYYNFKRLIQERDTYLENLPDGSIPDQVYLDSIEAMISQLYESLGTNQELFWREYETVPDVAVLQNGYVDGSNTLLNRFFEPAREVSIGFNPLDMNSQPILVIPSGGLYGLENSTFFKASLDEYVKNGGTLVVFAQQHGYEFSVLPVPQEADGSYKRVAGYGWAEDQSCFRNAANLDTYHQILAGQSKSTTPDLNVDGYFMNYPSNAIVLLRRTANGQPPLVIYDYGLGKVIVTSMYSDWVYGHSQASKEEIALFRDIISWSKKPAQLPDIRQGQTVSMTIEVINNTSTDAAFVRLAIFDPDRNIIGEQTVSISIPAGQSVTIPFSNTTSTSPLGIYHVDYALLDSAGNTIQPEAETDSGRFAVSNPLTDPAQGSQLTFSIQSDSEDYAYGSTVTFTVIAFNNSDIERTITAKYSGEHGWESQTLVVPARGSNSFVYSRTAIYTGVMVIRFYEGDTFLRMVQKAYWVYNPSVNVSVQTDKTLYGAGETVNLTLNIKNRQSFSYTPTLNVRVSDPVNLSIYSNTIPITLPANGTANQNLNFILPSIVQSGFYIVSAEAYDSTTGMKIGGDSASFDVPRSQISVAPNLPYIVTPGINNFAFNISNTGRVSVSAGTLDVSLKGPDGAVIYSGSQPFTLSIGESKVLDISIPIPSLEFGNYNLTYIQSDETGTGRPVIVSVPNTIIIALYFEKPFYKIREIANLTLDLINSGRFDIDSAAVTISISDANYSDTQAVSLLTANRTQLTYAIPIPETIPSGQHNVNVSLMLPSGSSVVKDAKLTIPESSLQRS